MIDSESLKKIMLMPDPVARREVLEAAVEGAPKGSPLAGWLGELPDPVKKFLNDLLGDVLGFFSGDQGQSKLLASFNEAACEYGRLADIRRLRGGK